MFSSFLLPPPVTAQQTSPVKDARFNTLQRERAVPPHQHGSWVDSTITSHTFESLGRNTR